MVKCGRRLKAKFGFRARQDFILHSSVFSFDIDKLKGKSRLAYESYTSCFLIQYLTTDGAIAID